MYRYSCGTRKSQWHTFFSYCPFSRICIRKYRSLCDRKCDSCMIVHQYVFRLQCITSSMRYITGRCIGCGGHIVWTHAILTSILCLWEPEISCLSDAWGYIEGSHTTHYRRFSKHHQHIGCVRTNPAILSSLVSTVQWPLRLHFRAIHIKFSRGLLSHVEQLYIFCIVILL